MAKDASTIKQEIEQTRERMGNTVEALGYKADVGARVRDTMQDRVDGVKGAISNVVENVKTTVSGTSSAAQIAGDTMSTLKGRANDLRSTADDLNDRLSTTLSNVDVPAGTKRAIGIAQENPIGLALTALSIGFLIGSLIPVSDVERKQLGPLRDKVIDQAQAATHDLVEAGKAVVAETAQSVVSTALSSAQSHGNEVVASVKARAEHSDNV